MNLPGLAAAAMLMLGVYVGLHILTVLVYAARVVNG